MHRNRNLVQYRMMAVPVLFVDAVAPAHASGSLVRLAQRLRVLYRDKTALKKLGALAQVKGLEVSDKWHNELARQRCTGSWTRAQADVVYRVGKRAQAQRRGKGEARERSGRTTVALKPPKSSVAPSRRAGAEVARSVLDIREPVFKSPAGRMF
jgi:hypothetical protein